MMATRLQAASKRSDSDLIASSLTAPEAFAGVFDRHFATVHRYLARRVSRERADDLASQTFTIAFERRAAFRRDALDARPWLLGIATNLVHNDRRARRRLLEMVARLGVQDRLATAQDAREPAERDPAVAAALAGLDADQRDVLLLVAWGELSYEEVAEALEIPVGTVRSRLYRARAHLRAALDPASSISTIDHPPPDPRTPDDR